MRIPLVHGRFLRKQQKHRKKGDFWVSRPPIVGPATYILFVRERCLKFLWYILKNLNKSTFLIFKMMIRCWDIRVKSYPTSAGKIKRTNCSAWALLYFMFMADGWNLCDKFLSPWTKSTFYFFQNLDSLLKFKGSKLPHFCTYNQKYQLPAWSLLYFVYDR